jgi:PIN domain nuclease of toxin-antitoxin system
MERTGVIHLLDTATWADMVTWPEVLPDSIRGILAGTSSEKGLCSVSLLECAIHHRLGRLRFNGTLLDFFTAGLAGDIQLLDVTPEIASATNDLPTGFPGDPFDRTIAATARVLNLKLITPDPLLRDAGFCQVVYYRFRPGPPRARAS